MHKVRFAPGGKQHVFGIVEDLSEFETNGTVNMLLYHDANVDEEYYLSLIHI